jgi:hypothetical protein
LELGQQSPGLLEQRDRKRKSSSGKREGRKRKILELGSSHGREIGPLLQENMGIRFDVNIYKPNAPLAKFVQNVGRLGKQDHIVIVEGPRNSLD